VSLRLLGGPVAHGARAGPAEPAAGGTWRRRVEKDAPLSATWRPRRHAQCGPPPPSPPATCLARPQRPLPAKDTRLAPRPPPGRAPLRRLAMQGPLITSPRGACNPAPEPPWPPPLPRPGGDRVVVIEAATPYPGA
jgi:hypothetical protein